MKYNQKQYQIRKTQKYLKNSDFFFIYHSIKLNSKESVKIEQTLKKLKLKQYKILNGIASKTFTTSVFKNYSKLVCGLIIFIKPEYFESQLLLNDLKKELKNLFLMLSIKLNNKIYFVCQISKIKTLSFKQNIFNLYAVLEKSTKTAYILKKQFETM